MYSNDTEFLSDDHLVHTEEDENSFYLPFTRLLEECYLKNHSGSTAKGVTAS